MIPLNKISKLKLLEIVARIDFFKQFSLMQRELLLQHTKCYKCKQGKFVQRESDLNSHFYIVLSGEVAIFKKEMDIPLGLVKAGEFIGESSFIKKRPKSAAAKATVDTIVLCMDEDTLNGLPGNLKDMFKDAVIEGMASRIAKLTEEIRTLKQ